MFNIKRSKHRGEASNPPPSQSSSRRHQQPSQPYIEADFAPRPGYTYSAAQPYVASDFAPRPREAYDASQPIPHTSNGGQYGGHVNMADDSYRILVRKADRFEKLHALLLGAANTFSETHDGVRGTEPRNVFAKLLESLEEDTSDDTSSCTDGSESVASETPSTVSANSKLRVVIMTRSEYRSWMRLSGLNSTMNSVGHGIGRSDWLQPMRHALCELALNTKRLEMRFGTKNMDIAIQQQHNLERISIESQFFGNRTFNTFATAEPKPASVLMANFSDEISILAARLGNVHKKAAAGVVPFCSHTLDLGKDSAAKPGRGPQMSRTQAYGIADPTTAHVNSDSENFSQFDVAMGYNLMGLAADTLKNFTPNGHFGGSSLDPTQLATYTYDRCDEDIRAMMGREQMLNTNDLRPAALFTQWLQVSSSQAFHESQSYIINSIMLRAAENRANGVCRCIGPAPRSHTSSSSRAPSSSTSGRAPSSSSSRAPPSSSSSRAPPPSSSARAPPSSHGWAPPPPPPSSTSSSRFGRSRREEEPKQRWR